MFNSVLVKATRGGSYRRGSSNEIKKRLGYSVHKCSSKQKNYWTVVFTIGVELMKQARFMFGDQVDVLLDQESGMGLIRRVKDSGRVLCPKRSKNCGTVAISHTDACPIIRPIISLENVVISEEGILFDWPKNDCQVKQ